MTDLNPSGENNAHEDEHKYRMSMSLNVLNHLGIKLYSQIPAVLSETVANAWDADAQNVWIDFSEDGIRILDDGQGMDSRDINEKYLNVGYQRRLTEKPTTPGLNRPVMGRKGIGKLSLFSIAQRIEVHSMKGGKKYGFVMDSREIERQIQSEDKEGNGIYHPDEVVQDNISIDQDQRLDNSGTLLILTDFKRKGSQTPERLRRKIARRFSIIGPKHGFRVHINNVEVGISDRDYFQRLQYLWHYGGDEKEYRQYCGENKLDSIERREDRISLPDGSSHQISGWIGTVRKPGQLKDGGDNLNKIVILARGKLTQEDILTEYLEGGIYSDYMIGEINADFLDTDDGDDIATSSRQEIIKDDPRYQALREWMYEELKFVQGRWSDLRKKSGTDKATENVAVKEWFDALPPDYKERARALFGKINQLTVQDEEEKKELLKSCIIAFEQYRYKQNLDALDRLTPKDLGILGQLFADCTDIEATLYYQIVKQRVGTISALHEKITADEREKVIQKHIFDALWLLDPSWDRGTTTPLLEKNVQAEFEGIDAGLTPEEKKGRVDIKYKAPAGEHVVIELKRASTKVSSHELAGQLEKYTTALRKLLKAVGRQHERVEGICILGQPCTNWKDLEAESQGRAALEKMNIRVIYYDQLIDNAYRAYSEYLKANETAGRVAKLVDSIEASFFES